MKRLLALVATVAAFTILALPASASGAGAMSFTQTVQNGTASFPVANPCTGVLGTVDITFNAVFHITVLTSGVGAGTGWATFTQTGDFVLTQIDGVTITGHFTGWDGENLNLTNFAATGIFVIHGTGSDGTTVDFHDVFHITVVGTNTSSPTVVVTFEKPTCG
jgi:hypothetical protein